MFIVLSSWRAIVRAHSIHLVVYAAFYLCITVAMWCLHVLIMKDFTIAS